jgi:hypothetical protein
MDKTLKKILILGGIALFLLLLAIHFIEDEIPQLIAILSIAILYFVSTHFMSDLEIEKPSYKEIVRLLEKIGLIIFVLGVGMMIKSEEILEAPATILCPNELCNSIIIFMLDFLIYILVMSGFVLYLLPNQFIDKKNKEKIKT